jgi:hypothetical protein
VARSLKGIRTYPKRCVKKKEIDEISRRNYEKKFKRTIQTIRVSQSDGSIPSKRESKGKVRTKSSEKPNQASTIHEKPQQKQ